jgi:molecular chaperone GrpE
LWPIPDVPSAQDEQRGESRVEPEWLDWDTETEGEASAAEAVDSPAAAPGLAPPLIESPERIIAAISQLGSLFEQRLSALQATFEREVRAEATRERIVDRLHTELQEYKQDLLLKVQRPIFIDLIQLHDDIGKTIESQPAEDPDRAAAIRGFLESIRTAIEDILYRQGVEPFQNEGDDFDPRRQRAVTTVPTDFPERSKTVAGRLRPGFRAGEKIIRPEIVSVHTLKK